MGKKFFALGVATAALAGLGYYAYKKYQEIKLEEEFDRFLDEMEEANYEFKKEKFCDCEDDCDCDEYLDDVIESLEDSFDCECDCECHENGEEEHCEECADADAVLETIVVVAEELPKEEKKSKKKK